MDGRKDDTNQNYNRQQNNKMRSEILDKKKWRNEFRFTSNRLLVNTLLLTSNRLFVVNVRPHTTQKSPPFTNRSPSKFTSLLTQVSHLAIFIKPHKTTVLTLVHFCCSTALEIKGSMLKSCTVLRFFLDAKRCTTS